MAIVDALQRSDTRLAAHASIKPQIPRLQQIVLEHLSVHGPQTTEEVELGLELPHQTVSPRIGELRDKGLIWSVGERKTRSGRRALLWSVR